MKKHTIDAKDRVPGRVATEAAVFLMGKNRTDYSRNAIPDVEVEIVNASGLKLEGRKLRNKGYYTHSLYPGGLKRLSQEQLVAKKGASEILRKAIYGMLPKNKLRPKMMNNLEIKN